MGWILKIVNIIKNLFRRKTDMPSGLEIYNDKGKLVLGVNYKGLRFLGIERLQPLTGSTVVYPKPNEEVLAFAVLHPGDTVWHSSRINFCTVNGNNVSWSFSENDNSSVFGGGVNGRVNVYIFGRAK